MRMFMDRYRKEIRAGVFLVVLALVIWKVSDVLSPIWMDWNNYDTVEGFYEQPEETIETVFLGASHVVNGITPMELYEEFGMSAYNLGTEQQPMMASYYWLLETYRLHGESLKNVVLETSMIRKDAQDAFYKKAFNGMHFSGNKWKAICAYTDDVRERISFLFPLYQYHSRWKNLGRDDFGKSRIIINSSVKGYHFSGIQRCRVKSYENMTLPVLRTPDDVETVDPDEKALKYMQKIIDFCKEHELHLLLINTPGGLKHSENYQQVIEEIASEHGLVYMNFNYLPYVDEISYCEGVDNKDGHHLNYYGASKVTRYIGSYLVENYGVNDMRKDEAYSSSMEEELEAYHRNIISITWNHITDPAAYIQAVNKEKNYALFAVVMDEASSKLTEEQRMAFSSLGLDKLSKLTYRESYLGLIENGQVIFEDSALYEGDKALPGIRKIGSLSNDIGYTMTSGGYETGYQAAVIIDGREPEGIQRGINYIVYDMKLHRVVDVANFDTLADHERNAPDVGRSLEEALAKGTPVKEMNSHEKNLYLYIRRYNRYRQKFI